MEMFGPVDELSRGDLLDRVDLLAETDRKAEVARLPGRERARRYGGDGTPLAAEFAAAEFGARAGLSPYSARQLIGDALDLQHRFPLLWARVEALEVRASYARSVARRCRELSLEQAMYVDGRVAESADGRISWSRFETLVEAAIKAPTSRPRSGGRRRRPAASSRGRPVPTTTGCGGSTCAPTSA